MYVAFWNKALNSLDQLKVVEIVTLSSLVSFEIIYVDDY